MYEREYEWGRGEKVCKRGNKNVRGTMKAQEKGVRETVRVLAKE